MRLVSVVIIIAALAFTAVPAAAASAPANGTAPAATEMAPGLVDDIFEPFFEDDAFPLQSLIALHPDAPVHSYRGRCLTLHVSGADRTAQCERRLSESVTGDRSVILWFGLGREAIGLETVPPLDPPKNGVLRYYIGKVYRVQQGKVTSESAMGSCRMDSFYLRCQTIGKSGGIDAEFATVGGPPTEQYPLEDAFFRYKNAVVYTAPGQCIRFYEPKGDATPYCASFVGRTLVDGKAAITIFTKDAHLAFGFYGLTSATKPGPNGSAITPVTYLIRVQRDHSGTAPVVGSCQESPSANGRTSVDCQVKTVREGVAFAVSFETSGPWHETRPLDWQQTGGNANDTNCEACPRSLVEVGTHP